MTATKNETAARQFAARHGIDTVGFPTAQSAVEFAISHDKYTTDERQAEAKRLRRLWAKASKN